MSLRCVAAGILVLTTLLSVIWWTTFYGSQNERAHIVGRRLLAAETFSASALFVTNVADSGVIQPAYMVLRQRS